MRYHDSAVSREDNCVTYPLQGNKNVLFLTQDDTSFFKLNALE